MSLAVQGQPWSWFQTKAWLLFLQWNEYCVHCGALLNHTALVYHIYFSQAHTAPLKTVS